MRRRATVAIAVSFLLACGASALAADSFAIGDRARLRIDASAGSFELDVLDEAGKPVWTIPIPGLWLDGAHQAALRPAGPGAFENDLVRLALEPLGGNALALTFTPRDGAVHELRFRIRSDDETRYYGTGERFNALNQRGFILPNRVDDRYGNKGVGTHKPIPFFMSSRGFAVWIDTFATGTLDLSGSARFDTDLTFRDSRLRVVLIGGPSFGGMLETFTALTGRSPVPPPWAFGLWKSRDVHRNRAEVLEDVEKLRGYGIPASVLVLDSPWETGYNDFVVNRAQFEEPESMFRRVEELGFRLALWLTPFVNSRNVIDMKGIDPVTRTFAEAAERGVLVKDAAGEVAESDWWKGTGGLVDFTDPKAKAWWRSELRKMTALGARAFKCDDGEGNFVPDALFADGTPSALMKNRYADLYNASMQELIDQELGGDGILIVRSGYTGVQKYPFSWAGDNRGDFSLEDGLPSVVLAAQNAAFSGISLWGSDIAGYAGTADKEVFIRWSQFATFTPLMQIHMTSNRGPWDFDEETLEIFRKFAVLRMRLFPYLYDAVHETARSGMPVIRPMALAFAGDVEAHRHVHQFMFGPDLLVAPVVERGTRRSVYLPAGSWLDYWSREGHDGPKTLEAEAPLDRIPLFVRAGAILPLLPDGVQTLVPRHAAMHESVVAADERRVLEIWPGPPGTLATSDGLHAEVVDVGGKRVVRLRSDRPRAVEIRIVGSEEILRIAALHAPVSLPLESDP